MEVAARRHGTTPRRNDDEGDLAVQRGELSGASSCQRKGQKISLKRTCCRAVLVVADQEVADDFAGTADLLQTVDQFRIGDCEVEQLQGPFQCSLHALVVISSLSPEGSADLGADIAELLGQGQFLPSTGCESGMSLGISHRPVPTDRLSQ